VLPPVSILTIPVRLMDGGPDHAGTHINDKTKEMT
jgi:hypothetical protein